MAFLSLFGSAHLSQLATDPDLQGRGLGGELLQCTLDCVARSAFQHGDGIAG